MKIIEEEYDPNEWNIYAFHFSDGDNWSSNDTQECLGLLSGQMLPDLNLFCYGQVESEYGSGQFLRDLNERFEGKEEKILSSRIESKDKIFDSIKVFLGKGK